MTFNPVVSGRFRKDYKLAIKRGYEIEKLDIVMRLLIEGTPLPSEYRDHLLSGNYSGRRECYIKPNWLLIYAIQGNNIVFERTGTHTDLFD